MRLSTILGAALTAAALAASLHAQTGDTPPSLIYRSEPEYSAEATRARVQATVTLSITVGEDGKARDIRVAKGAGFGLDEKAIDAMDKWRFNPATHNGQPAAVPASIEMNFSILAKNDKIDHSGQHARLNFTLPPHASRPELIAGQLPGNPTTPGEQSVHLHLRVDADGEPKDITALSSTDPAWAKQAQRVIQTWRFLPAEVNGSPVVSEADFEIEHMPSAEPEPLLKEAPANVTTETDEPPRPPVPHPAAALVTIAGLTPRDHHTATLLPNGTVLLTGGSDGSHPIAAAQVFDWATRHIVNTGSLSEARSNHTATLLRDGTILVAGGYTNQPTASAEIFDPSTGTFAATGSLHEARELHVAVALPDGRVLIAGGVNREHKDLISTEIYNPRTKTFTLAASMMAPRSSFQAVNLKDGRVLFLGGSGSVVATAEIYDPATAIFRPTGRMNTPRVGFTATLLPNGKVLITGGEGLTSAELYDPVTGSFTATGSMSQPHESQQAIALADGKVLITGSVPEIYDPSSATFEPAPAFVTHHAGHTVTLLQDGSILIVDGNLAELLVIK